MNLNPFAKTDPQPQDPTQTQPTIPDNAAAATPSTPSHTEEQKRHFYDNLPASEKNNKSYAEWAREAYNEQYEKWMPWLEDQYLKWFGGGDNKASYVAKDSLSQTKITNIDQVNQLQDDANNLVANQLGEKGFLAPVGNLLSKEGFNRAERGGKDESGSYTGAVTDSVVEGGKGVSEGVQAGVGSLGSLGSSIGGAFSGSGGGAGGERKDGSE
ncbi:hypothetical protein BJX76DRAFT_98586 [Aspergillus varians]